VAQSELGWALTRTYVFPRKEGGPMQKYIEVRLLVAIVTLSEELNFTRAAKRLGITQSGLSRRVGSLEKKHRIKLFERDHANVVLTEAGRVFVEEAKLSLMHDERAIEVARAVSEGLESVLTIGRSPYARALPDFGASLHPSSALSEPACAAS
jgi:DNA-binding transcriptional LysR family regulator